MRMPELGFAECPPSFYCGEPKRGKTNADRIRAMSDEELANWITDLDHDNPCPPDNSCSCHTSNCMKGWLDWLRREVTEC